MKRLLLILLAFVPQLLIGQQIIVKFNIHDKSELKKISTVASIDRVKGDEVIAYLWGESNYRKLESMGYKLVRLPHPSTGKSIQMATTMDQMANWDRYPTYDLYVEMMQWYASHYPDICLLDTIGYTQQNRLLLALKITDNPQINENEPEFFYTSTMHGDETTGYVDMLRLIDSLLKNYNKNSRITNLVNNVEIWINPLANPDGTYHGGNNTVSSAQRYYNNGVDPNRNFPDPDGGAHPDGNDYTVETIAMMNFANNHNFNVSANFHGGAEVFNYPWDTWSSSQNPHADQDWFIYVGTNYVNLARAINSSYMTDVTNSGITEGYDWYEVEGGRQDYMNYWHHCHEVTIELSSTKLLDVEYLPMYWNYTKEAFLYYLEQSLYGFRGVLMDNNGNLLSGTITIPSHDHDGSAVVSDTIAGDYHRLIIAGTYDVTASVDGYSDITATVSTTNETATIQDFIFGGEAPTTDITFQIVDTLGNYIPDATVIVSNQQGTHSYTTDQNGSISIPNAVCGTYKFEVQKEGYLNLYFWETVTPTQNSFVKTVAATNTLFGYVVDALTGEVIYGATVKVNGTPYTTNEQGYYQVDGLKTDQTYNIVVSSSGYQQELETINITSGTTNQDFALLPIEGIGFEDGIPDGFSFSGDADWFRTNSQAYEGAYSMQSGDITDNQTTTMTYTATTVNGVVSFAYKVSSEQSYDKLYFYIDGIEKGNWSGEIDWTTASYTVSEGTHTFQWSYQKDGSVSSGEDCAWVDLVSIPTGDNNYLTANITFVAKVNGSSVSDVKIHLWGYGTQITASDGSTVFQNVYRTTDGPLSYTATLDGYNDITGSFKVFNDTTIVLNFGATSVSDGHQIVIYPNPVKDQLYLLSPNTLRCVVYSLEGKVLLNRQLSSGESVLDFSKFDKGVYILELRSSSEVIVRKIVKY